MLLFLWCLLGRQGQELGNKSWGRDAGRLSGEESDLPSSIKLDDFALGVEVRCFY